MFLTSPYIEQAITRFDRWSTSDMAIFRQLGRLVSPENFCGLFGDIAVQGLSARSKLNLQTQGAARAPGFLKVLLDGLRIHHVVAWADADGTTERPVADRKCRQILP
jgi:hypothetical protein